MSGVGTSDLGEWAAGRGLDVPRALLAAHQVDHGGALGGLLYQLLAHDQCPGLAWVEGVVERSRWPLDPHLIPLLPIDDRSIACVVASEAGGPPDPHEGAVVRWHLDAPTIEHQAILIDTAADEYVRSVLAEREARGPGLRRLLDEIGPALRVRDDEGRTPEGMAAVQIASQDVVVAMGAFAADPERDGLAVVGWQTCEVAHVAAHEGVRTLSLAMLQRSVEQAGTGEIRFDRPVSILAHGTTANGDRVSLDITYPGHPEMSIPAALRRYGRASGLALGAEEPGSITPTEARELFLECCALPPELVNRIRRAGASGLLRVERICLLLQREIWSAMELDFLLAVSPRAGALLNGGTTSTDRAARQAEVTLARAAVLADTYRRRLEMDDAVGVTHTLRWRAMPGVGGVHLVRPGRLAPAGPEEEVIVIPRAVPSDEDLEAAASLVSRARTVLLVPRDADFDESRASRLGVSVARSPATLRQLDATVESKIATTRRTAA